jgi:hypothetical protein
MAALGSHPVNRAAMGKRHHPARSAPLGRIKPAREPPDFEHDLLHDLLGQCGVTDNLPGDTEHPSRRQVIDLVIGTFVAAGNGGQQVV